MLRRLCTAGCLVTMCVAVAALPGAQSQTPSPSPPGQSPTFRGGVTFVNVDAYPRRDGRLVEGLRAEDFAVFEDGKPQKIEAFEFITVPPNTPDAERRDPNTAAESATQAADPRNRVFVIYLDIFHTTFAGAHNSQGPLLEFLGRTIGPTDLFGVATPEAPLPVSRLVFGRRIDTLQSELAKYTDWGLADQFIMPSGRLPIEEQLETCSTVKNPNLGDKLVALQREATFATGLEDLMNYLRDLRDERKNLLFISEGWRPAPPDQGLLSAIEPTMPAVSGPAGRGRPTGGGTQLGTPDHRDWCNQQIQRLASIDFQQQFRDLVPMALRANVTFYSVDVGGLRLADGGGGLKLDAPAAASPRAPRPSATLSDGLQPVEVLQTLAENTGGLAIVRVNDLSAGFRRISDELSGYYLLGYASTNPALDGKFRRIDVKVNQPTTSVTARRGYLAPTRGGLATVTAKAAAGAVPAGIADELDRLSRLRGDADVFEYGVRTRGGLDVVAELSGAQVERDAWRNGADVRAVASRSGSADVVGTAHIDPGVRATIVHVAGPDGDAGPWQIAVRVSAKDQVLDDRFELAPTAGALLGAPICFRGAASPRIPLRPVADFQFRRSERLHVEWPVLKTLDQRAARVLDRRGQPLALNATVTEGPADRQVVSVDLQLAPLAQGDYLIEVSAGAGSASERQVLAFRVVP